jgi:hypothetical protein
MASIDNRVLIVLGLVILAAGVLMPAETTDTDYGGYEATTTSEEVEIKTPTQVLGVGFILAGIVAKQRTTDEQTTQPPDD